MTKNLQINEIPHNTDAENSLIGLSLLEKRIPLAARELATTDFYDQTNRAVWSAFLELEMNDKPLEWIDVYENFSRSSPHLAQSFTAADLVNKTRGLPFGFNPTVFVKKLQSCANRRYLIKELAAHIGDLIANDNADETILTLRTKLGDIEVSSAEHSSFTHLADILEREVKPALADLRNGVTRKISTGFPKLDAAIGGGLSLSDVVVVAGMPGAGKSGLVLQIAANIAKQGIPAAFLSGEMSNRENALRLISQSARYMNLNSVVHLPETDYDELLQWADALKKLPLYFDSKTYDLQTLGKNLRRLVSEHGIQVLVIDYIQLLKLNRYDRQTRHERISEASQEVKRIANEFGIAVLEVAQFNREGAKSAKPSMSDLEGSSQLEKDASLIFILDRDADNESKIALRIVKGRNSGQSQIDGAFFGSTLRFDFER